MCHFDGRIDSVGTTKYIYLFQIFNCNSNVQSQINISYRISYPVFVVSKT